jgi:hypothetical protein
MLGVTAITITEMGHGRSRHHEQREPNVSYPYQWLEES